MKFSERIRKSQLPLLLALGAYGLAVLAFGYLHISLLSYAWLPPFIYLLLAWISLLLPGKLRVLLGILGTIALNLPALLLQDDNARSAALTITVPMSALLIWSMRFAGWEREKELSSGWLMICFSVLGLSCFLATFDDRLLSQLTGIRIALLAYALLAMLSMNRSSWTLATGNRRGSFPAMRRKNVLLVFGLFGIAVAVALIPSAVNLLQGLMAMILAIINKLSKLFPEETEATETLNSIATPGPDDGDWIDKMAQRQASDLMIAILNVVGVVVAIPLVLFGIYFATKKFWKLLGEFYHTVTDGILEEAADYADEVTDIRDETEQLRKKVKTERRRRIHMTPVEKIRYRYLRLMQKNPKWGKHSTARENLTESAAQLYEKARYSNHEITWQDADRFKEETE